MESLLTRTSEIFQKVLSFRSFFFYFLFYHPLMLGCLDEGWMNWAWNLGWNELQRRKTLSKFIPWILEKLIQHILKFFLNFFFSTDFLTFLEKIIIRLVDVNWIGSFYWNAPFILKLHFKYFIKKFKKIN